MDSDDIENITFAEAIAIQGNEIMAVGSNNEIQQYIADWTEVIDAKGLSVLPGLIDTHNHLYENTLTAFPWVLNAIPELIQISITASSPDEMLEELGQALPARARQVPAGQWIQVRLNPAQVAVQVIGKTATKQFMDPLSPENPVVISTRGGAAYNSLGIASIEERFRNPIPDDFWIDESTGWSGDYTDGPRCVRGDIIITAADRTDEYTKAYFEVMQLNAQNGLTTHKTHI
ncbi:MAG: amidohydrolase family protein, partial [Gammaproteobacteria bacterium]|nr:amidohydrolase family protein [Gammaproteobacteria bacterium]NIO63649.1 amidohydrolase family protein [Gammaproteobacteria bacterium]